MLDPKLFQIMAEQVRDYAVFLLDPEGHVMSWSAGAQLIKGYAPKEIIGKHFSVFYPPEAVAAQWPQHDLKLATREGRFEDEGWRLRKDGTRFWANVVITALRDEEGHLVAFSKITRDLTERRRHEEDLRHSEERFRLLVEGVVDYAVYMLAPDGIVTSWNAGAERMKGYRRDEIIGRHYSNFFIPEEVAEGKPWEELATARREGRAEVEGWRVRKDGTRFWARIVVTALRDARGTLRGFAKVTQDLTQRRHIQELEAAAKQLNEFIALLAHEIRNPLAPLQTALAVMRDAGAEEAIQERMRAVIERQAKRLARIAEDMADVSRVTRGALAIEKKPVRINDVIQASVEVASPLIQERQHALEVDVAEDVAVDGDHERLVQVFGNLLNNAAKYTAPGGRIRVRSAVKDDRVEVSVSDTGRGISAEELPTIFRMFVQGRTALERVSGGMGVGLALAKSVVELHGGTIEARSTGEGQGAEFVVTLPSARLAAQDEPSRGQRPSYPVEAKRVLIVDDNADAAHTLDVLLKALGHETRVVYDGKDAVRAFDEFQPNLVLLDIGLPGMSGYEVAQLLRSRGRRGVRIVALTGWGQAEDRRRSREAGFDLHLVKPIDEEALQSALRENGNSNSVNGNGTLH
ncbi:MAG: PAS domain S-box protein [Clostridia bacterium]